MSGVSMCRVVWVEGREGALWLPAVGIRASQGTFSSFLSIALMSGTNGIAEVPNS